MCIRDSAKGDHITDLKVVFDVMRAHQLKMNPTKSFLGVASGKFLGFVVTSTGIHLDPEKVSAIQVDCKDDWHTSEGSSQISLENANPLPN